MQSNTESVTLNMCMTKETCSVFLFAPCSDTTHRCFCPNCGQPSMPVAIHEVSEDPLMLVITSHGIELGAVVMPDTNFN